MISVMSRANFLLDQNIYWTRPLRPGCTFGYLAKPMTHGKANLVPL